MRPHWDHVPLSSEVVMLSGGTPKKSNAEYWDGDIPWVSSGEMTQRRIWDTQLHVTEDGAKNGTKCVPKKTVLVVVRGMSLAKEFRVALTQREVTFNQDLKALKTSEKLDSEFLYYYLLSQRNAIRDSATEASHGTKKLETVVLERWPIPLPELKEQRAVVGALSSYDDLIENNCRRIALLEEAAWHLYKEWFVRFRFPAHEHVEIIDGLPDGWSTCRVGDLGEVVTGKTPSTKQPENFGDDIPFIKTPDMHGNIIVIQTEKMLSERGASTQPKKLIPARSILVSCIGTVGVTSMNAIPAHTNQQINAVVPAQDCYRYFAYFALASLKSRLKAIGGGVTMANVNKGKFANLPVLIPTKPLMHTYHDLALPVFDQIEKLARVNLKLAEARDLLLPKLMNGELAA